MVENYRHRPPYSPKVFVTLLGLTPRAMAKEEMFRHTDHKMAPWRVVKADNKKLARLNCIRHLLSMVPYEDLPPTPFAPAPRPQMPTDYVRPPMEDQTFVPDYY